MRHNVDETSSMSKVKVAAFSVSLDGFGAGPCQDSEHPLGVRGFDLMEWFTKTAAFHKMHHLVEGTEGVDNDIAARSFENVGAWILGRNMFGPIRGPWLDDSWKGWWGEEPPYHVPVFVLTHHAREPLAMKGNTTFYFVTDGPESALRQAKEAAGHRDVRIGGGVATVRQYLAAGLIDELHLAFAPVLLGEGENLFAGLDLPKLGYRAVETIPGEGATHVILKHG
jgi:dihydrofolate reductase